MQSEPGPAEKTKLGSKGIEVTLWDRWEYDASSRNVTLKDVVEYLEKTHKLEARDVFFGSVPLYMHALNLGKDRNAALSKDPFLTQAHSSLSPEALNEVECIDLTVTFVDPDSADDQVLEGVPPVRVYLPSI